GARVRLLARVVRSRDPHVHCDGTSSGAGARADAVRDLGLRGRLLVRPHEERVPGHARPALRRAARRAARGVPARARPLPPRREPGGARPRDPHRHQRRRSRRADAPCRARRGSARSRTAVRASGGRRDGRAGDGAGDRARRLLGGRRRPAGRGQLPDHRRRRREALQLPGRLPPMTFWTGELNDPYAFDAEVGFYDTTLRDGEQTVGVVLTPEDKLELARGLDVLGIERIEAGFPRVSQDDWRAVELIRDAGLKAEIWGFSRAVEADVKALVELGVAASVIESPISDLKLDALGVDREAMLERIVYAVSFAAEQGIRVAFFGVDGTRADPGYFETVYKTAVEAGAPRGVRVDPPRVVAPEAGGRLLRRPRRAAP